jgi:curved DNA-binding protein
MPAEFQDYYKTLGVSRSASSDEIKSAFRRLAREFHPDVARNKRGAEEKFKQINEAYEVLGDPERRKRYDDLGANWSRGAGSPYERAPATDDVEFHFGGTGFSDFFESFFGSRSRSAPSSGFGYRSGKVGKGEDIEGEILVTLDEAAKGSVRAIMVERTQPRSRKTTQEELQVRIPAGVRDGQRIRLPGHGAPGRAGGPSGDIYLRVKFAKHPDFRIEGGDLFHDLDLAPWEAVLGGAFVVPTLEGDVSVKIPPGTDSGLKLRLKGRGLPDNAGNRGNMLVVVRIVCPKELSETEQELWQRLARTARFRAR